MLSILTLSCKVESQAFLRAVLVLICLQSLVVKAENDKAVEPTIDSDSNSVVTVEETSNREVNNTDEKEETKEETKEKEKSSAESHEKSDSEAKGEGEERSPIVEESDNADQVDSDATDSAKSNSNESKGVDAYFDATKSSFLQKKTGSENQQDQTPQPSVGDLGRMIFSLLCVLLLIAICAYFLKKMGVKGPMRTRGIRIKTVHSLGPKERMMVVEVYGKNLLVGVTPHMINTLYSFDDKEIEQYEETSQETMNSDYSRDIQNPLVRMIVNKISQRKNAAAVSEFEALLHKERGSDTHK